MSAYLLELVDGGDAVGVERDQPDAVLLAELQVGGQLGQRGRLADAGRADQGDDVRADGLGPDDRAGGRDASSPAARRSARARTAAARSARAGPAAGSS